MRQKFMDGKVFICKKADCFR